MKDLFNCILKRGQTTTLIMHVHYAHKYEISIKSTSTLAKLYIHLLKTKKKIPTDSKHKQNKAHC